MRANVCSYKCGRTYVRSNGTRGGRARAAGSLSVTVPQPVASLKRIAQAATDRLVSRARSDFEGPARTMRSERYRAPYCEDRASQCMHTCAAARFVLA